MDVVDTSTTTRGLLSTNGTVIQMRIYPDSSDTSNYRAVGLRSTNDGSANLENSVYLYSRVNGTGTAYDIYNEYNLVFSLSGTTLTITKK